MPRVIAAKYVYSGAGGECFNDYVTSPPIVEPSIQHHSPREEHGTSKHDKTLCESRSPQQITNNNPNNLSLSNATEQLQIHTISSSDENEFIKEQNTMEEEITNISSNEIEDFEGFDDYTTPNTSELINNTSQEIQKLSKNYLARFTNTGFNNYFEDSEGVGEAIEVDEDEEISIGCDENVMFQSKEEITPKKKQKYNCEHQTPNKHKMQDNEHREKAISPTNLKTMHDQIVEINSDSTTNSIKQKRQQINNKYQINLSQQQLHKYNNTNRCSTESTSEFPVSSPSNPQQPIGGKYPPRPPLLKNTLPADSFERQLAMITAYNPQMTLAEKIQSWECDDELSDVEDVNMFDEEFKRLEKQNKLELRQREKNCRFNNIDIKNYDFLTFRQKILNDMKEQKKQKLNANSQGAIGICGGKCMETSGSESSKSVIHVDERPSTSAVAQQQLQQRRSKIQANLETGESKKRMVKEAPKRKQNSTTPPQTSSSDNERDFVQNQKNHIGHKFRLEKILCPSSSEEAISQDVPTNLLLESKTSQAVQKNLHKKSPNRPPLPIKSNEKKFQTKNSRALSEEEIDSVFRLHRLNHERDKQQSTSLCKDEKSNSIIQMHLDFANENKSELLIEKKQELFKTPIVPQKYLANVSAISEKSTQFNTTPTKNQEVPEQESSTKLASATAETEDKTDASCAKMDKNSDRTDFDGVYHQQHEFCNYLGLTGMSTATAMANAVAELAQCNLARRSMRVLRQQQERKDKTAKDRRLLEKNFKSKKQADIRKSEKESRDTVSQLEACGTANKSEECSHCHTSEGATSTKEPKKKTINNSMTKLSTISQHSASVIKNEPEIKILCHIATNKKQEVEQVSKECVKEITQPIRQTLMRQVKQLKSSKLPELSGENTTKKVESINKMNKKYIMDEKEIKTDCFEKLNLSGKISSTRSQSHHSYELTPLVEIPETIANNELTANCSDTKSISPQSILENFNNSKNISLNEDKSFIPPSPNNIQQKIKMALEESRKSRPSIFIVQSIECKKNISNNVMESEKNLCPLVSEQDEIKITTKYSSKKLRKIHSSGDIKNIFKKGKIKKKYPASKRQLRKRKIIVLKSSKPNKKLCPNLAEFKRELRSSPKGLKLDNCKTNNQAEYNKKKSYRTVHTETNDLDLFLNNNQTKKRIMAKASALLERSRRMSQRNRGNLSRNKSNLPKMQRSKLTSYSTNTQYNTTTTERLPSVQDANFATNDKERRSAVSINREEQTIQTPSTLADNDNVVVSSTTNTFEERLSNEVLVTQSPITLRSIHNSAYPISRSPLETKEQVTQCNITNGIKHLNNIYMSKQSLRNPLKSNHGSVLYIYNELEILIVIQERLVSFWKCSKLINILTLFPLNKNNCNYQTNIETSLHDNNFENSFNNQIRQPAISSITDVNSCGEWIKLGELRRLTIDTEISVPYANRICLHNSTPLYIEMRAHELPKNHRDCNLLSIYINIYYYHDEEMIAKCNSIQLDTIQSNIKSVNYTTLIDSRYFIMTWPQENLLGKTCSGLCKYSITPQLDTLASIREFKNMRHTIHYLQCMSDDKLIGFGDTQITIWDHRSGDVIMNFDLEIPLGKNLGSIYFASQDIEQNNMLILHQYRNFENNTPPVLMTLACTVTHTQPSYRILQEIDLPIPDFKEIKCAIKTGDHLVITGQNDDELWICATKPTSITIIPGTEKIRRFYNREKSLLIELTEDTLNVNSLANYVLQLAASEAPN